MVVVMLVVVVVVVVMLVVEIAPTSSYELTDRIGGVENVEGREDEREWMPRGARGVVTDPRNDSWKGCRNVSGCAFF